MQTSEAAVELVVNDTKVVAKAVVLLPGHSVHVAALSP